MLGGGSVVAGAAAAASVGPVEKIGPPNPAPILPTCIERPKPYDWDALVTRALDPFSGFEVVEERLWDSVSISGEGGIPSSIHLFSVPLGQRCPHRIERLKGIEHTNIMLAHRLPVPDSFWIKSIKFWLEDPAPVVKEAARKYAWTLVLGCKNFGWGKLGRHIDVDPTFEFSGTRGLYLPQNVSFSVHLDSGGADEIPWFAGPRMNLNVEIGGLLVRPVS